MEKYFYDSIEIIKDDVITKDEVGKYVRFLVDKYPNLRFKYVELSVDPEDNELVNIQFKVKNIPFEKIKRIKE